MSRNWRDLSPKEQQIAAAAAEALLGIDALTVVDTEGADRPARVAFRDLHAWVTGPPIPMPFALRRGLQLSAGSRRDLDRLLKHVSVWHAPRAAAASSGDIDFRRGDNFSLSLRPSRGGKDQIYILIELASAGRGNPTSLVVRGGADICERLALPPAQDGVIQILTDANSPIVSLLRDAESEIFLW